MPSTHRGTLAARLGRCLASTTVAGGLAAGATVTAGAEAVWDIGVYDSCLAEQSKDPTTSDQWQAVLQYCCIKSGGDWAGADGKCVAPVPEAQNVPRSPEQTTIPPILDPGQIGPSNPLIPTPRGPNGATLGR
ncbi:hypothetical protein ABGB19_07280 [Mycobacterium sp. B14F4]|uniref:hypothetical protein n=1 Tax=Mycobacterium sp. B14F4 TaxID=3153565 RepID=UPI00325D5885